MDWVSHLDWTIKLAAVIAALTALLLFVGKVRRAVANTFQRIVNAMTVPSDLVREFGPDPGGRVSRAIRDLVRKADMGEIERQIIHRHIKMGFYFCSPDGQCIQTNQYLDDLFGLPPKEMLGAGWMRAVVDHQRHLVASEWRASVRYRIPYRARYQIENQRTGELKWVETEAFITMEGETIIGLAGYLYVSEDQEDGGFAGCEIPVEDPDSDVLAHSSPDGNHPLSPRDTKPTRKTRRNPIVRVDTNPLVPRRHFHLCHA